MRHIIACALVLLLPALAGCRQDQAAGNAPPHPEINLQLLGGGGGGM